MIVKHKCGDQPYSSSHDDRNHATTNILIPPPAEPVALPKLMKGNECFFEQSIITLSHYHMRKRDETTGLCIEWIKSEYARQA